MHFESLNFNTVEGVAKGAASYPVLLYAITINSFVSERTSYNFYNF